jgi:diguanylate cyclase (GGDEF)-like protein
MMQDHTGNPLPKEVHRRALGAALLLALALTLASLYAYRHFQNAANADLDTDTDVVLGVLATRLQEYINAHLGAIRVLRNAWQRYGSNSYDQFRTDVLSVTAEFPGFQAINWVDNDHRIRWVFPEEGNRAVVDLDVRTRPTAYAALQESLANGDMSVTAPFTLTQGGRGIVAYLPLRRDGRPEGLIDVAFRLRVLVGHVYTDEIASRYLLRVRDGGEPVFVAPGFENVTEHVRTRDLRFWNRTWHLELAPRAIASPDIAYIRLALAVAIIGALSLAILTYHLLMTRAAHDLAAARVAHVANYDDLTGLGNRYRLDQRLEADQSRASTERHPALLLMNVGRTRLINGVHGPNVGDALLRGVAGRLAAVCGRDNVFRLSGDEFAAVLPDCGADRAREVASTLVAAIAPPFEIDGLTLEVPCAIGIAIAPEHGRGAKALMRAADTALFAAREDGEHQVLVYDDAMRLKVEEELNLAAEIRAGLTRGEFRLVYQPVINLRNGTLRGFEALVRWQHPVRGMVSPDRFIPVAESSGLIEPLGRFVLHEACRQAQAWTIERGWPVHIAVNVSPRQLLDLGIVDTVREALLATGLPPRKLMLEITESLVMENIATATKLLESIKQLDVGIAMDDFGTGYSSLSYLTQLPIDLVKIDSSFTRRLGADPQAASLLEAIIKITRVVGLKVVAEGVETDAQLRMLQGFECDYAQGYLFSRPVPPEEGARMLGRQWSSAQLAGEAMQGADARTGMS